MAKIAIIKAGGKQYKVKVGDVLKVEKITQKPGEEVELETLLVSEEDGHDIKVGGPSLGKIVKAQVEEQGRGKKIRVVHYKAKVRYHKTAGHRQPYSKIKIVNIE
jgi:large subunit ribosomal protein L21